jgi:transcriptional regulator with GAF, ATPase, and Fis domain
MTGLNSVEMSASLRPRRTHDDRRATGPNRDESEERDVLRVMQGVIEGKQTQAEAARLLKRSVRQVRRLQRRLEADGDGG